MITKQEATDKLTASEREQYVAAEVAIDAELRTFSVRAIIQLKISGKVRDHLKRAYEAAGWEVGMGTHDDGSWMSFQ